MNITEIELNLTRERVQNRIGFNRSEKKDLNRREGIQIRGLEINVYASVKF